MAKVIGIDLGTSNSAAAFLEGGRPTIIPSAEGTTVGGGKAFPSYVAFTKDGQRLVGEPARRQAAINAQGTIQAAKRKMGLDYKFEAHGQKYTPQQISAFILQKIKEDAEAYLGDTVDGVVITCPAYFDDNQRAATKDAGAIAGLNVLRIINEPTAACLAYGLNKSDKEQKIMVFDLGGGTLDVTIMEMAEGVFEVKSTHGDTHLGGTDMDNALIDYIADQFNKEQGIDLRKDKMALQRLREGAEKAKIELSSALNTDVNLPFITADASGPKHLTLSISRAKLEDLINPIVERCREPIAKAIKDAQLTPNDIDRIIMVGGPTRMPIVQKFVEDYAGKKIEGGVDPMECVAMGAAIQAGIIKGDVKDVLLLDVTPLSLGIETLGSVCTRLIERNTTIPTKKSQTFSTAAENQTEVTIRVLQGERQMAGDNVELGQFNLTGIPPAPRGMPQIEVTFDIDANGLVHVHAKDKGTGKEQSIKITAPKKLSEEEIEKMVKEAEKFADADKKKKEDVETRNQAEQLAYATEKSLKEHGDKVQAQEKETIEKKVADLKEALKGTDSEKIKTASEELSKASHKLAEAVYKAQAEAGGAAGAKQQTADAGAQQQQAESSGTSEKENVVDADFKVEEESK